MLMRIKKMLERERVKHPGNPALILFGRRFLQVARNQFLNVKMMITKDSTFESEDSLWMCSLFPKRLLDEIILELKPRSVLDVGCGTGQSLNYFLQNKIDAIGIENSEIAIAQSPVKDKIVKHNLNKVLNLSRSFDLVWCFEVIEHIHPDYEANFLKTLTNHSNFIIISAARPGQGGHGHFNEQEPEYWIHRFDTLGYSYAKEFTEKLKSTGDMHVDNIICFKKK